MMIVVSDGRHATASYGNIEQLYQYHCYCCCYDCHLGPCCCWWWWWWSLVLRRVKRFQHPCSNNHSHHPNPWLGITIKRWWFVCCRCRRRRRRHLDGWLVGFSSSRLGYLSVTIGLYICRLINVEEYCMSYFEDKLADRWREKF